MNSKSYKFEQGFSLVELLVTTAITGVLVALSAANVQEFRRNADVAAGKIYLGSVHTAMVGIVQDDIHAKRVDKSTISQYTINYDYISETYTETRYNTASTISLADFITTPPGKVHFNVIFGGLTDQQFSKSYYLFLCDYMANLSYFPEYITSTGGVSDTRFILSTSGRRGRPLSGMCGIPPESEL